MSSGMSAGLAMQVAQRLEMALTPQMIQSMELLQMPLLQLEQRLRQEQLENPVLELEDIEQLDRESSANDDGAETGSESEDGAGTAEYSLDDAELNSAPDVFPDQDAAVGLERVDDIDYNWDDVYDDYAPVRSSGESDDEDAFDPIANAPSRPPSLLEHLLTQLQETPMPERTRRLAAGMAQKLDGNGWLTVPLAETAPPDEEPPPSAEELQLALDELQKLDPDGVGARNLSECLLIQLANRRDADPIAIAIADRYLEDLAANRLPKIAKDLKCGVDEVKSAASLIRTLNPRPGAGFSAAPPPAIRPELVVEDDGAGGFSVRLTSGVQPYISEFFTALFDNSRRGRILRERIEADSEKSQALSQFREQMRRSGLVKRFREKYNNAQWLVKAVAQRKKTLLAVAEAIVKAQQEYLSEKSNAPAPLFMQEIADQVGYDISTVSRAVKDKYIDTPIGIKPLKDFFSRTSGVAVSGEETSNASVLLKIKEMIENEDKRRPLRDNEIMKRLADEGIALKRRSIVNYREKLGYPSHSHRKEF